MAKYKNATNLVHPYFMEFRHRNVVVVACGDHHALFLIGAPIDAAQERVDYEVFGVGENSLGQITGAANQKEFKTPVLIAELSGKGIEGICAVK